MNGHTSPKLISTPRWDITKDAVAYWFVRTQYFIVLPIHSAGIEQETLENVGAEERFHTLSYNTLYKSISSVSQVIGSSRCWHYGHLAV